MNHGDNVVILLPNIAGKSIENLMEWSDKGKFVVNNFEMCLKLIIGLGTNGSWEVKWVGLADKSTSAGPSTNAQPKPNIVAKSPRHQVWKPWARPRNAIVTVNNPKPNPLADPIPSTFNEPDLTPIFIWNPENSTGASSSSIDPKSSLLRDGASISQGMLALASFQSDEIIPTADEVDHTWGTANDWFTDLRDGRQLQLPMDIQGSMVGQPILEDEDPTSQKLIQWLASQQYFGKSNTDAEMEWGGSGWDSGSKLVVIDSVMAGYGDTEPLSATSFAMEISSVEDEGLFDF